MLSLNRQQKSASAPTRCGIWQVHNPVGIFVRCPSAPNGESLYLISLNCLLSLSR